MGNEYSPVSETHQGSRSPRRWTRKVQEITKQEDQNREEASPEYSLQVPVAQKDIAGEKEMRVKRHTHSPKTKEISPNLSMKRKRSRSRSSEQTSIKGKRRKR